MNKRQLISGIIAALTSAAFAIPAHAQLSNRPLAQQPAQSQSAISNPRGIVANFDSANLGPVFTELGVPWQSRQTPQGDPFILIETPNGLKLILVPLACLGSNNNGCVGMKTMAIFKGTMPAETLNNWNNRFDFAKATAFNANTLEYSRYDIADYGVPRGNVVSSLGNFIALAERFGSEVGAGAVAISDQRLSGTEEANRLNEQMLAHVKRESFGNHTLSQLHTDELARAVEISKRIDQNTVEAVNKISNID